MKKKMLKILLLKSGGILYVSTHGERFLSSLTPEEIQRYRQGDLVVRRAEVSGENQCSTYEGPSFVRRLSKGFSLVEYVPGKDDPQRGQDIYFVEKGLIQDFFHLFFVFTECYNRDMQGIGNEKAFAQFIGEVKQ